MLSSTVKEFKQGAKVLADDISSRAQAVATDVSTETRELLGHTSDRVARELATVLRRAKFRRAISKRPVTTLLVTAGAGALVAYWLSHRSPPPSDKSLH